MDSIIDSLGLADVDQVAPFDPRVVTGTIVAENADAALVQFVAPSGKKATGVLPVTEFYRGRRWATGERYTLLQCDTSGRPLLSATRPELVSALLDGIAPEVRAGQVRVMAVARRAGLRTKVAVAATEPGVDAVAACVGRFPPRVDHVKNALGGEQVDLLAWHPELGTYLRNALQPAQVVDVEVDEAKHAATASAPQHLMSAAVGGGGLNSALAGQLAGVSVRIIPD
jgi:N utilization substance protein A